MKIALVYDRINKFGGAERVLQALHQLWPQAPLYTAVYNQSATPWAKDFDIRSSFLQKFPLAKTHHELYPWLTPLAFESFNFDDYQVVISVTSAEAKAIITHPKILHLCYCLTPTRYLWSHQKEYQSSPGLGIFNRLGRLVFSLSKPRLQAFDRVASSRPDLYLAISKTVQKRISQYYHRHSKIIYPPVDVQKFSRISTFSKKTPASFAASAADYFLVVSRLTPYKKVDLAIKACNQLKENLVIVGSGREQASLKKLSGPTIRFTNQISDDQLVYLYQNCQALIMPQEEDFGIVALETQAAAKPVISFYKGGATETVIPGQTGIFFKNQTVDSLIKAVKQFKTYSWDKKAIRSQAKKFDIKIFKQKIKTYVEAEWLKHQKNFQ
jgi:glycosyltransferase involved in cell wall biosynthesis